MMASRHLIFDSQGVIPVMMGKDQNVTFIIDTSESMAAFLGALKNLIIQTLLTKASLRNSLFNIITYSYKITSLADHMIPCSPDIVYQTLSWIHTLSTSPGNEFLPALITAFSDPACQSVHLITNCLPDNPGKCLNELSALTTRPVHTFYISDTQELDNGISDFLKCLTSFTSGSCYRLPLNSSGGAEQVNLLYSAERQIQYPSYLEDKWGHVSYYRPTHAICLSPYWCSVRNPFSVAPHRSIMSSAEFHTGCRVLAKRETDGFYNLGTIVHQLQDRRGLFMVTFDKPLSKENTTAEIIIPQLTCQPDMINITKAHGHSIVPGDTVLAPWDPQMIKYGPGRIVSGTELRNQLEDREGHGLMVLFWNGIQTHVPKDLAVWISASHHEQIIRDLQLYAFRPEYPKHHHCSHMYCLPACHINNCVSASTSCCHCVIQSCPLMNSCFSTNNWWNKKMRADQMTELPNSQERNKLLSSLSSEDEEEIKDENIDSTGLELVSRSVNTDISCLKKFHTNIQSRPAWSYWKRGSAEPHHKKPGTIVTSLNESDAWSGSDSGYSSCNFATTNSSSLFEMVPNSPRKDVTIKEVFDWTKSKSHLKEVSPVAFALNKISAKPI